MERIKKDFEFVQKDPRVEAILLYGSYIYGMEHNRSDIDVCVVSKDENIYDTWSFIMENFEGDISKYDVRLFRELPLKIQGEIIKNGKLVYSKDKIELYAFFYPYRKRYNDWKFRVEHCI